MESPNVPRALANIVSPEFGFDPTDATYVLGKETVISGTRPGMIRWRDTIFALLHRNASSPVEHFELPPDRVIEIGTRIEI